MQMASHPLRWALMTELATGDHGSGIGRGGRRAAKPRLVSPWLLRSAGLIDARRSSFDGRDTYYHLNLAMCAGAFGEAAAALHPALARWPSESRRRTQRPGRCCFCAPVTARARRWPRRCFSKRAGRRQRCKRGQSSQTPRAPRRDTDHARHYGIDLRAAGPSRWPRCPTALRSRDHAVRQGPEYSVTMAWPRRCIGACPIRRPPPIAMAPAIRNSTVWQAN